MQVDKYFCERNDKRSKLRVKSKDKDGDISLKFHMTALTLKVFAGGKIIGVCVWE